MKSKEKKQARDFRKKGMSISDIAEMIQVSKSTVSIWVRDVALDINAKKRLKEKQVRGRTKALKVRQQKKLKMEAGMRRTALSLANEVSGSESIAKLACSLLYWCGGEKAASAVRFSNADPLLIQTFLTSLRRAFQIDEDKFSVCLHLHEYHDELQQMQFWSKITGIPVSQFIKPCHRPNTGKRKKHNYQGCASIRYHDYRVFTELKILWETFGNNMGASVNGKPQLSKS